MPVTAPGDAPRTLPALVARQAARTPDALAVVDGDTTLTYARLVAAARALAGHLREHGVAPGDPVGLLMPRSVGTVVAQLALWWAGAVCVPLDPAHPRPRTEAMAADAGVTLIAGDGKLLESAGLSGPVLRLPRLDLPAAEDPGPAEPAPDATAFIMFTSGSTGRPKGVAVPHRAAAELLSEPEFVTLTPRDRVLFHSPATFDASTFEVWGALANGAAVVVCTVDRPSFEDLAQQVERHGVTVAFLTTALFHRLAARRSRIFSLLRGVVVGGEALAARPAREVLRAFPWLELVNGYGPTEATTFATAHRVTDADCDGQVPIGRPVAGATLHILDEAGRPVPAGARGELWIGGSRLSSGYVGRPDLTAERFLDDPATGRRYRTGDLVSARPDGVLLFHGRLDDQVKVRGHRIEPGEIEHALREQPEVAEAAVTVHRPTPDDARLAGCVVPAAGPVPRAAVLRERLAATLPAHLVPDELLVVDRLPLTSSGKVDRRALAGLFDAGTEDGTPAATALTPLQQAVADIWSRALGTEVTSPDADFLALGGHSLLAMGVADDLREELGVELALADFFAAPTLAAHAALLEQALLAAHPDPYTDTLHPAPAPATDTVHPDPYTDTPRPASSAHTTHPASSTDSAHPAPSTDSTHHSTPSTDTDINTPEPTDGR
ncbi:non-ribosomal peptide synthetase [Streptomyces sp. LP05-1]|uniref:Non-ribosomal peptide synthetase n=1 Tax=Streptomyces pyxinae TaxID=2970734 RepID=A0ABT2CA35_9ACTN|nr:non-ribosomal peptide synthetase [Streptomyces sp. LP05-1]MCS0634267.1 non-ribosomal peptide synthetase [Streptomyces sp. LP05-1]